MNIIKIRRKGKVGRGVWIGAVSGMVVGALAGFADGDDPEDQWFRSTASEKALGLGLTGAVIGTGVGPLIASKKEIIIINGLFRNYEIKLKEIQSYSLKPFKD